MECPACKGNGGHQEDVVDGMGLWFDCGFCDGKAVANLAAFVYFWLWKFYGWLERKSTYLERGYEKWIDWHIERTIPYY